MSVLRLLSPSRAGPSAASVPPTCPHSSAGAKEDKITIDIQLLTNGTILMEPPTDPLWPHARTDGPREDQLLNGDLDIQMPRGTKRRRCKSVRVGVRTKCRLHMGPGRGWEEDVVFERKVEMMGGNAEGIVLDEGMQRFEFTLILPSTLAPHDWHPNGSVVQELFAEIEGQPTARTTSSFNLFGRKKRDQSRPSSRTPSRSPSPTSAHHSPRSMSPILAAADSLSITRQEVGLPAVPSYDQSQADPLGRGATLQEDDWIVGTVVTSRSVQVTHNPNPAGRYSDLDQSQNGFAEGLGIWDLKIMTDVFSIGGPLHARLTLPSPSPGLTVWSWRLRLKQTHTLSSPRDDSAEKKSVTQITNFDVAEYGTLPPRGIRYPDGNHPALWRGQDAGGSSEGEVRSEGNAVMPKHHGARPTTLPGVITPIEVSHAFLCEIYFSVWGEDDRGIAMSDPGPGGLRYLQIIKPVIVPSCSLVPARLDVPNYAQVATDAPCPDCGHKSNAQMCTDCAPSFIPHPRHDLNQARSEDGFCLACYKRFEPVLDPYEVELCACLLDTGDVERRMARFWEDGQRAEPERGRKLA